MKPSHFLHPLLILILLCTRTSAQTPIPFDSPRWSIKADSATRETFDGREALRILKGAATLPDAHFTNGIIEFDIAFHQKRSFPGIRFRIQDSANAENYYLRPHQSGNPDAQQYYPEYNASGSWQLYYGDGFNNAHTLPFDHWLHIKMLISGSRAEIYFDNEKTPALYISHLLRPLAEGMIQLQNGYDQPAWFANFTMTPMTSVPLLNATATPPTLPETMVKTWQVSQPFAESDIENIVHHPNLLHWEKFTADFRGISDLSSLARVTKTTNTIICRLSVDAPQDIVKKLSFGFSDRIRVYCNGKLLYAGADVFMSRDYRFLGTIGFFDTVFPELKKGQNEIWLAISEDYGGWGVQARLDSL